jgi:hypothetical protein
MLRQWPKAKKLSGLRLNINGGILALETMMPIMLAVCGATAAWKSVVYVELLKVQLLMIVLM